MTFFPGNHHRTTVVEGTQDVHFGSQVYTRLDIIRLRIHSTTPYNGLCCFRDSTCLNKRLHFHVETVLLNLSKTHTNTQSRLSNVRKEVSHPYVLNVVKHLLYELRVVARQWAGIDCTLSVSRTYTRYLSHRNPRSSSHIGTSIFL